MHKLVSKLAGAFTWHTRNLRARLHIDTKYQFGDLSIALPANHNLPIYQRANKLYDRFLPHLSKYVEAGSTVIDVGANCGDTVAAMFSVNNTLSYICIEADDHFYRFLRDNVARIKAVHQSASIQTLKAFVGKSLNNVTLSERIGRNQEGHSWRRKAQLTNAGLACVGRRAGQDLVTKTDVDGFDYDVIDSAEMILAREAPMLFFECQFDHEFQKDGYKKILSKLKMSGYDHFSSSTILVSSCFVLGNCPTSIN